MKKNYKLLKIILLILVTISMSLVIKGQANRAIDGYGNNPIHPEWGTKGTHQMQITPIGFSDGIGMPGGVDRPNPREISNAIFNQEGLIPDVMGLSDYAWIWGQFIDHDITLSPEDEEQPMSIPIPMGDPYFDPDHTGVAQLHTLRSIYDHNTGTSIDNPRRFPNEITAFIDGSAVYGSDMDRASKLRSFKDGKLRVTSDNFLPYNTIDGEYGSEIDDTAPFMAMASPHIKKWHLAGDLRANENILLTSIHTLFVREHNRIAEELAYDNPYWSDEQVYQKARKIVGGIIQAIVYEEWLPTLGVQVPPYSGYDENVNPAIFNVFASAAYRYGHTVINSTIVRMGNDGEIIPEGNIRLKDAFFNPPMIGEGGGIEPLLNGMASQVEQDFDTKMIHDLRNFLFGPPGAGGLDLASLNINRGRERGLPDYNSARMAFGLEHKDSFEEITPDRDLSALLETVYGDVDNIDPWVGFLAEEHMPNTLFGETVMHIMEIQFTNLRDGDRYYYENDSGLSSQEIDEIKGTRLADVIRRNSNVQGIQDDVFVATDHSTTGIENMVYESLDMKVYPNPSIGNYNISMNASASGKGQIMVYDMLGHIVFQNQINIIKGFNQYNITLDDHLVPGLYHMRIIMNNQVGNTSLIKSIK
ncbi:MAG: T9SS type A sorting domain-containing protein [Saprospiraceae bacterium]|nr:T9SS type A sorting domain-containing protein [Saprospiraceae bacterium]